MRTTPDASDTAGQRPLIVGFGGTQRPGSTSELALRYALGSASRLGCDADMITVDELMLPIFDPGSTDANQAADALLAKVRAADGLFIATPGYHGNVSGLIKNALDYLEGLAKDPHPYLHGRAVGCIVTAAGWQASITTLSALRATVHALRGWTAPQGVAINSSERPFGSDGTPQEARLGQQLDAMVRQVVDFSEQTRVWRS